MREISRCESAGETSGRPIPTGKPVSEKVIVAKMRQWFFARKPDAGFLLEGFPATMLQATMFDEWLDARDESLDGVVHCPFAEKTARNEALVEHYRTLGLLIEENLTNLPTHDTD